MEIGVHVHAGVRDRLWAHGDDIPHQLHKVTEFGHAPVVFVKWCSDRCNRFSHRNFFILLCALEDFWQSLASVVNFIVEID